MANKTNFRTDAIPSSGCGDIASEITVVAMKAQSGRV